MSSSILTHSMAFAMCKAIIDEGVVEREFEYNQLLADHEDRYHRNHHHRVKAQKQEHNWSRHLCASFGICRLYIPGGGVHSQLLSPTLNGTKTVSKQQEPAKTSGFQELYFISSPKM